jgi:hypothetical protein
MLIHVSVLLSPQTDMGGKTVIVDRDTKDIYSSV